MSPKPPSRLRATLLGPNSTFKNTSRPWLYGGFLLLVLVILGVAALKGGH